MNTDSISKKRKVWRRLSEIGIIVFSILLAFWIDASWQGRQAAVQEQELLDALKLEVAANREQLDDILGTNNRQIGWKDRFFDSDPQDLAMTEVDSVRFWLAGLAQYWTYDPETSAAKQLSSYDGVLSEYGRRIHRLVNRWTRVNEDMSEDKEGMIKSSDEMLEMISLSSAEAVTSTSGMLYSMAATSGPELLVELRSTPEFVAAVMVKSHRQKIYLLELNDASGILDSLITALD